MTLLLTGNGILNAQNAENKLFRVGFKVAPNYSWINYKTPGYSSGGGGIGFSVGFVSDYFIADNIYVETGFNFYSIKLDYSMPYSMAPDSVLSETTSGTLTRNGKLHYFEIPASLKYCFISKGILSMYAHTGVQFGFNYRAKVNQTFSYTDETGHSYEYAQEKVKIDEDVATFKFSYFIGGDCEFAISKDLSVFLALNFNIALTNMLSSFNTLYPAQLNRAYPRCIELSTGIFF
ncbi:MAG: outer membrane beta-barrel protein [Bacteroidales bacterium]|nr:outer membrane beta-barrel protein [Bacteroidales bacterium]